MTPFESFWQAYPTRIAKKNAQKAFDKAIKETTLETILAGVERYKQTKPEWCSWAHPASWLNAGRWDDEPALPALVRGTAGIRDQIRQELSNDRSGFFGQGDYDPGYVRRISGLN